jgi:hypothetical protein
VIILQQVDPFVAPSKRQRANKVSAEWS